MEIFEGVPDGPSSFFGTRIGSNDPNHLYHVYHEDMTQPFYFQDSDYGSKIKLIGTFNGTEKERYNVYHTRYYSQRANGEKLSQLVKNCQFVGRVTGPSSLFGHEVGKCSPDQEYHLYCDSSEEPYNFYSYCYKNGDCVKIGGCYADSIHTNIYSVYAQGLILKPSPEAYATFEGYPVVESCFYGKRVCKDEKERCYKVFNFGEEDDPICWKGRFSNESPNPKIQIRGLSADGRTIYYAEVVEENPKSQIDQYENGKNEVADLSRLRPPKYQLEPSKTNEVAHSNNTKINDSEATELYHNYDRHFLKLYEDMLKYTKEVSDYPLNNAQREWAITVRNVLTSLEPARIAARQSAYCISAGSVVEQKH